MEMTQADRGPYGAFLEELTALTHKYGIQIRGCGCCDSPWLEETTAEQKGQRYAVRAAGGHLQLGSEEGAEVQKKKWQRQEEEEIPF